MSAERATPASDIRDMRRRMPRSAHGELILPRDRDPIGVLERQHATRLPDLVPVRVGRMLQSPFAFYRGSAAVMAADLRRAPVTGIKVVACGDAHLANLGFFASPERRLLFDLNDFDEAGVAPWEWDLRRLAASVHIAGREAGLGESRCGDATTATVRAYRTWLAELMGRSALERFHAQADMDAEERWVTRGADREVLRRATARARRRTSDRVLANITTQDDRGSRRIVEQPPIMRRVPYGTAEVLEPLFDEYRSTVREDVALLLGHYKVADVVLRVVGVGSVGTRCYILLLEGPDGETLFLQAKEAAPSVLVTHGGMSPAIPGVPPDDHSEGRRVVAAQRILQSHSDPFLGWVRGFAGDPSRRRPADFYIRQYRDMKGSIETAALASRQFTRYGQACGRMLARAHSQSPGARVIGDYLGSADRFDEAVAAWGRGYADVCEADHAALRAAVAAGRLPADEGV